MVAQPDRRAREDPGPAVRPGSELDAITRDVEPHGPAGIRTRVGRIMSPVPGCRRVVPVWRLPGGYAVSCSSLGSASVGLGNVVLPPVLPPERASVVSRS